MKKVRFYILFLKLLPKNFISRIFGKIARIEKPKFIPRLLINKWIKLFKISLNEVKRDKQEFNSLSDFFVRELKEGLRPIDTDKYTIVSPADCRVREFGKIDNEKLIQVKGIYYSLSRLIINEELSKLFVDGNFISLYLSPKDYHRMHSPIEGKVFAMEYVPGKLFPVNNLATENIESLYTINERITTFFETEFGSVAFIKIGAMCVGSIKIQYDNIITNKAFRKYNIKRYYENKPYFKKGEEIARFEIGSSIVLLFEKNKSTFVDISREKYLKYGEKIAKFI